MSKIAYIAIKGMPIGGGIEKLTEEIGSRMVEKGHEVLVYTSRDYGTVDGIYKGMKIRTVPSINTKSLHKLSICLNAILDISLNEKVDIVHIHAIGPSLFAIFARIQNIPTIVQTHGLEWKRDKWGSFGRMFFKIVELSAVYFPHATTAVSLVQKNYFEKKYNKKISYIPTGVNFVKRRSPKWLLTLNLEPNNYLLFAARLVEEKGAHFLIEAFRNINTDMNLVIAGDAAHSEKYKRVLKKMAEGDNRIRFLGFITGNKLEELFSNAYLFCLPSTLEGLPIALLEAMSYGNCCVASDIPENLEAIKDYGYIFRNRDPIDLESVLRYLISNPQKVEVMKAKSVDYVMKDYSWDKIANQMEDLYSSISCKINF